VERQPTTCSVAASRSGQKGILNCPEVVSGNRCTVRSSEGNAGKYWRKGWDSNPRESCPSGGFQDRCLKPLGHPSARCAVCQPALATILASKGKSGVPIRACICDTGDSLPCAGAVSRDNSDLGCLSAVLLQRAVPQREDMVEAMVNLLIVGHDDHGRLVLDRHLA
jgi:hypothetical protein